MPGGGEWSMPDRIEKQNNCSSARCLGFLDYMNGGTATLCFLREGGVMTNTHRNNPITGMGHVHFSLHRDLKWTADGVWTTVRQFVSYSTHSETQCADKTVETPHGQTHTRLLRFKTKRDRRATTYRDWVCVHHASLCSDSWLREGARMIQSVFELQDICLFFLWSVPPLHPSVMVTHDILNCVWFYLWSNLTESQRAVNPYCPSVREEYYFKCENY